MRYFIDTEFIEGFKKPLFGKKRHFIDLISIGIVASDGREYYAISNEFNAKDADDWVYKNVIQNIELDWVKSYSGDGRNRILDRIEGKGKYGAIKIMQKEIGKSNKQISKEIIEFIFKEVFDNFKGAENEFHTRTKKYGWNLSSPIEFYGYYADYDWVLFCSLFGRMIDLPKDFPMYCKDLNQYIDDAADKILSQGTGTHSMGDKWYPKDYNYAIEWVKRHPQYPKQENEHNALADAKWNKRLFEFLKTL